VTARSGFWAAAFAFLIVMAVATLPSPLYGLYRTRDHLSALTITVVFAIFAAGTIAVLQRDSSIAARIGRRGTMLAAVATMMVAMAVLAAWKDLPGLLIGRLVTGVSVGLAAGTAITYLIELSLRADPKASPVRARTIGTSVSGVALFLVFASGVMSQLATTGLRASRVLALGTTSMLAGLALLVVSVRLAPPSLALFLIAGALIGAGSGAVFKGTTGIVLEASPPESRVAMTSDLLIALYVGLAVPVIGAGVALDLGASAPDTVLGFAIIVGLGVAVSGWALLSRTQR
jgi:MFS family permease